MFTFQYLFIIIYLGCLTGSVEVGGKPVAELEHIRRGSVLAPYSDQEISESVTGVVTVRRKMKSCDCILYVSVYFSSRVIAGSEVTELVFFFFDICTFAYHPSAENFTVLLLLNKFVINNVLFTLGLILPDRTSLAVFDHPHPDLHTIHYTGLPLLYNTSFYCLISLSPASCHFQNQNFKDSQQAPLILKKLA